MAAPDPELLAAIEEIVDRVVDKKLDEKLDEKLDAKFDEKLEPIYARFDTLEGKVDDNTRRIGFLSEQIIRLGTGVADNRRAISRVEDRLDRIDARIDNFIMGPMGQMLRDHERRLGRVEHLVGLPKKVDHD